MIAAIASSPPPRARAANRSVQFGSVLVVGSLTRQTLSRRCPPAPAGAAPELVCQQKTPTEKLLSLKAGGPTSGVAKIETETAFGLPNTGRALA